MNEDKSKGIDPAETPRLTVYVSSWCLYDYKDMCEPLYGSCVSFESVEDAQAKSFKEMTDIVKDRYAPRPEDQPLDVDAAIADYVENTGEEVDREQPEEVLTALAWFTRMSHWHDVNTHVKEG